MLNFFRILFTAHNPSTLKQIQRGNYMLQTVLDFNIKEVTLEEKIFKDTRVKPSRGISMPMETLTELFYLRDFINRLTFFPGIQDSAKGGGS